MAEKPITPADAARVSEPRRSFLSKAAATLIGTLVAVVPMLAAGVTFLDPLLRGKKKSVGGAGAKTGNESLSDGFLKITTTQNLAPDGTPRMFPVVADLQDAWNKFPNTEIGSVYLWQTADGEVGCFNARCPHLGCTVNYKVDRSAYVCPCHDSAFSVAGERTNQVPPRDMDPLQAQIRNGEEVWVRFRKFRAGIHERVVA